MPNSTLSEKTVVLTGATSGIGAALAEQLAGQAKRLIIHGPESPLVVQAQLDRINRHGNVSYHAADFASLAQVRRLAEALASYGPLDLLINNAGIPGPPHYTTTRDGFERCFQVNYLAMVLLNSCLAASVRTDGTIVNVGSGTHRYVDLDFADLMVRDGYEPTAAYYNSKLAIVTYSLWLARQPGAPHVVAACPGLTQTGLITAMFGKMGADVETGAEHLRAAAFSALPQGSYMCAGVVERPSDHARDIEVQNKLMAATREMLDGAAD